MQGLPLVYLFLYLIKQFLFFFLGGGVSAKLMFGYNMGVFGGWWGPKLWIHRPGWRFWLCPVELANVPGWQMTTRHSFPRLGPNPRVTTGESSIWLQLEHVIKGETPGRTSPAHKPHISLCVFYLISSFQFYTDKDEGLRPPNPPPVRAVHRLTAWSQCLKTRKRLAVSLTLFQRGIEVGEANCRDLRKLYLHETKG